MSVRSELPNLRIRRRPDRTTVVRGAARLLVLAGIVLGGLVAYQMWITGLFTAQAQDDLRVQFEAQRGSVPLLEVPYERNGLRESPFSRPDITALPGEALGLASIVTEPSPLRGEALGRLIVPAAGIDWAVVEGVGREDLRRGPGHMPGTAVPGQPGNAVISGHRTTYGAPFGDLDALKPGDAITVQTAIGDHVYRVVDTMIVAPGDVWVTDQWDGSWLTLTTCHPEFSDRERLVVVAALVDGPNAQVILET